MTLPPIAGPEREQAIIEAVSRGEHCAIDWADVAMGRVVIRVAHDALRLAGVRVNVTAETAQRLADLLGCTMPTPKISDAIHLEATVRISACTQSHDMLHMADTDRMLMHSEAVRQKIAGRKGLASTLGKEWVLSAALRPGGAVNYGWHDHAAPYVGPGGLRMWQTGGTKHNGEHTDYSQIYRPVSRRCTVDGIPADLSGVLRGDLGAEVSRDVSYDGILAHVRQPGVVELAAAAGALEPQLDHSHNRRGE